MLMTPSRTNNPGKNQFESKAKTSRITFPPREATTTVEAVINALQIVRVDTRHFVWSSFVLTACKNPLTMGPTALAVCPSMIHDIEIWKRTPTYVEYAGSLC